MAAANATKRMAGRVGKIANYLQMALGEARMLEGEAIRAGNHKLAGEVDAMAKELRDGVGTKLENIRAAVGDGDHE